MQILADHPRFWASPILAHFVAAGLSNECLLLGFPVLLEGLASLVFLNHRQMHVLSTGRFVSQTVHPNSCTVYESHVIFYLIAWRPSDV